MKQLLLALKLSISSLLPSSWPFLLLPTSAQVQADNDDNGYGSGEERLNCESTTNIQLPFITLNLVPCII
jgi:hypothetical protein